MRRNTLPVTELHYGGSGERFSWILYELGFLQCNGKAKDAEYPSEIYKNHLEEIDGDIDQLKLGCYVI